MDWYFYIALVAILPQLLFWVPAYSNYRYALNKYKKKRSWYRPRTVLLVPCKDLNSSFQKNITSFFNQDYKDYLLWFVVADKSDPAYKELCKLKDQLSGSSKAQDVQVFVAGKGQSGSCSQKNHNLLYCYRKISDDIEVLVFADSDICVRSDWLSHIVYPLHQTKNGAASGYRWFVPKKNNLASLALSAVNAKVAQLLGNTLFNQAWGGSMAIRLDVFCRLGLENIWSKALSDDLTLSYAVKRAGLKVVFVPACIVASYESTTWGELFEFGRRQFLITRVSRPATWWFGLCSSLYSVLGLWGTVALAARALLIGEENLLFFIAAPILFLASQMTRAILRQKMIDKLLEEDRPRMRAAAVADIFFPWIWSLLLLFFIITSAFGNTICWGGIRYKLLGPTETMVIGGNR